MGYLIWRCVIVSIVTLTAHDYCNFFSLSDLIALASSFFLYCCQVLKDGMLENLTPELFIDVNKPKCEGTVNLDV